MDGRHPLWVQSQTLFMLDEAVSGHGEARDWPPNLLRSPQGRLQFLETAHPFDISRRFRSLDGQTQLTWTLGFDMERGTILRARLRGRLFMPDEQADWASIHNWQSAFLAEPLPLDR